MGTVSKDLRVPPVNPAPKDRRVRKACRGSRAQRVGSPVAVPASGAWLDPSINERNELVLGGSPRFGRMTQSYTCTGWTNNVQASGQATFLDVDGSAHTHSSNSFPNPIGCAAQRPIACCR